MKKTLFRLTRTAPAAVSLAFVLFALLQGCESSNQPDSADPTTRALADPMNYSPNMDSPDTAIGGNSDSFDKAGFQRDVDHVLNP